MHPRGQSRAGFIRYDYPGSAWYARKTRWERRWRIDTTAYGPNA
jgi:hypothetical protein